MNKFSLFFIIVTLLKIYFTNPVDKEIVKHLLSFEEEKNEYFIFSEIKKSTNYSETIEKLFNIFRKELTVVVDNSKIGEGCRKLMEEYLLEKNENNTNHSISNYHIQKLLQDSSKHKNDLGTYEQCLFRRYKVGNNSFADSNYVVFILDKSEVTKEDNPDQLKYVKNNSYFDDVFYIRAFCLPQAKKDFWDLSCSNDDYLELINNINIDLNDALGLKDVTNVTVFNLDNYEKEERRNGYLIIRFIPVFLCSIQIILIIFRELIITIFNKCYEKKHFSKINDISEDIDSINKSNKEDDNEYEDDNITNKKEVKSNKIPLPNWIKIYNECFNFSANFKELFNFSLNSTDINNDSGLTYIRGLKSSSLFLLMAGLTYLTFMNCLSKLFSKTLFYEFLKERIFYSLFFIGLRYSPRIILSCSGYTLAYKYLCYINKNFSFSSILKFIFYQIHKYLILIGFLLFERYSLYDFNLIHFQEQTPMWKYFNKYILSRPESLFQFIFSFFTLSSIFTIEENSRRYGQTLIDYFWLPYNEISFFIIGVIIISIGYKCKLRIDFFLLILIVILTTAKIIYSYLRVTKEGEIYYATLYYLLFDYGKFMINPLFNLPCYLIGMYFGIINYSVQKGIISLYISELFKSKSKTHNKKSKNEEEIDLKYIEANKKNEEEDEDEDELENNNFYNNSEISSESDDEKNYRIEIKQMPFLISGVKIANWLRKNKVRLLSCIMILIVLSFISVHFIVLYYTIGQEYNNDVDGIEDIKTLKKIADKNEELLTLTDYITNKFINAVYRFDIEIVVFLSQSLLFIFYFKGHNFINDFFCHVFWAMLNKSYFSYILVANPMILFIFYQSETKILVNLYNLLLYSLISGSLVFLTATFSYIFFELPYKKLIHHICSDDNKEEIEVNDSDEKEDKSDDDDDDEDSG